MIYQFSVFLSFPRHYVIVINLSINYLTGDVLSTALDGRNNQAALYTRHGSYTQENVSNVLIDGDDTTCTDIDESIKINMTRELRLSWIRIVGKTFQGENIYIF